MTTSDIEYFDARFNGLDNKVDSTWRTSRDRSVTARPGRR